MAEFVIVGINDPYDQTPLQPDIINSSGQKLWAMTGLSMPIYVKNFKRYNLFRKDEKPEITIGHNRAGYILNNANVIAGTFVLCLGQIVARSFGVSIMRPLTFIELKKNVWGAYVPHTSGLNRWYNLAKNREAATNFMRVVGAAASGEISGDDVFHILGEL
jgi:hypothetical protein